MVLWAFEQGTVLAVGSSVLHGLWVEKNDVVLEHVQNDSPYYCIATCGLKTSGEGGFSGQIHLI